MRDAHNFALQSYIFFFKYTSFFFKKCCFLAMRFLFLGKKRLLTYKFTKFYVFSAFYCLKIWSIQKKAVPLQPEMRNERISLISVCTDSLAQLVEHNTFNVGVVGSSPTRITQMEGVPLTKQGLYPCFFCRIFPFLLLCTWVAELHGVARPRFLVDLGVDVFGACKRDRRDRCCRGRCAHR